MDRKLEVRLSWTEAQRLQVLEQARAGAMTQVAAAQTLGVTDRWVRSLLERIEDQGAEGLVHGNRGRTPAHRISDDRRSQIVDLYRQKYEGFNLTHFREMLLDREHLKPPCREVLRRVLTTAGAWERRRDAPQHRLRRPRREREGELLQVDASLHRWFGQERPPLALLGAMDDATGEVVYAVFFPQETTEGYFHLLAGILRRRGIPGTLYTDRDSTFVVNVSETQRDLAQAQGRPLRTHFGRALEELGVEWIPAHSPQAKGRIERLWKTFQDRLFNEFKLEGITTMERANEYLLKRFLPRFNRHFRHKPARPESVYRPAPARGVLESILCWKESRTLARDHTFSLGGQVWQVYPSDRVPALTGKAIEVRRTLKGQVQAWYGTVLLEIRRAPASSVAKAPRKTAPSHDYPVRGKVRW